MPWSYANIDWNGTGAMVQAIGSVAAIWFAGSFAHRDRLVAAGEQMDALAGVFDVAVDVVERAATALERKQGQSLNNFPSTDFARVTALLDAVPSFALGSSKAAGVMIRMRSIVEKMAAQISDARGYTLPVPAPTLAKVADLRNEAIGLRDLVAAWRAGRWVSAKWWWWPFGLKK